MNIIFEVCIYIKNMGIGANSILNPFAQNAMMNMGIILVFTLSTNQSIGVIP